MPNIYTYVVEHDDPDRLDFRANMEVNGGKLLAVAFYDALKNLELCEEALLAAKLYILGEAMPTKDKCLDMIRKAQYNKR
jgi:hypothetical protein